MNRLTASAQTTLDDLVLEPPLKIISEIMPQPLGLFSLARTRQFSLGGERLNTCSMAVEKLRFSLLI